ncbi:unnamed protein product [Camellia sinensis]
MERLIRNYGVTLWQREKWQKVLILMDNMADLLSCLGSLSVYIKQVICYDCFAALNIDCTFGVLEGDFPDKGRQPAQCVGRVFRSKADYGMMIFADKRYSRHDKRSKLPGWILSHLRDAHLNLSTDMAMHIAREFLQKMAQPYDKSGGSGKKPLLSQEDLEKMGNGGLGEMLF